MRILVIEDELPAYKKIVRCLDTFFNEEYSHAHSRSVIDTIHKLESNDYDLIISDIELLDGNVFQVFQKVSVSIPIIFSTAYDSFVLDAFKENGIAYLIKPYFQEDFDNALTKYLKLFASSPAPTNILQQLDFLLQREKSQFKKRILIKRGKSFNVLETEKIVTIEAFGDLVKFIDISGNQSNLSKSIGQFEKEISPQKFFRINRSQIINIDFIESIESYSRNRLAVKMKNIKKHFITSSSKTKEFKVWVEK